jgi:hypothetical protein
VSDVCPVGVSSIHQPQNFFPVVSNLWLNGELARRNSQRFHSGLLDREATSAMPVG